MSLLTTFPTVTCSHDYRDSSANHLQMFRWEKLNIKNKSHSCKFFLDTRLEKKKKKKSIDQKVSQKNGVAAHFFNKILNNVNS